MPARAEIVGPQGTAPHSPLLSIGGGVVGGWWGGGPTATIDIPTFLCYGTAPGTTLAVCFFLYIARDKFTPAAFRSYMQAYWRRIGAACYFRIVPGAVRGSRRIVVWYSVLVCCVFDTFPAVWCVSRRRSRGFTFLCGAFTLYLFPVVFLPARSPVRYLFRLPVPGHVPRLPVRVLLSRRRVILPARSPAFPGVPGAGNIKPGALPLRSGLFLYYHTTTL